jgi:hypothetical protein
VDNLNYHQTITLWIALRYVHSMELVYRLETWTSPQTLGISFALLSLLFNLKDIIDIIYESLLFLHTV